MGFNDTAVLVLMVLCGGALAAAFAITGGLIFSLAADAGRGLTHKALPVRWGERWRRYEYRKITGR